MDTFVKYDVFGEMDTDNWFELFDIIDPLRYQDSIGNKLILNINSVGDEFFRPEDAAYWYNRVPFMTRRLHSLYQS